MKISLSTASVTRVKTDLLVVGVSSTDVASTPVLSELDAALGAGRLAKLFADERFDAKPGSALCVPAGSEVGAQWVLFVGIEPESASALRTARMLGVHAARAAKARKTAALVLAGAEAASVRAAAEGLVTGAYQNDAHKSGRNRRPAALGRATLVVDKATAALRRAVSDGVAIAESIEVVRDLVNGPPNVVTPDHLAKAARSHARKHGVRCTVWDQKKLEAAGMELFLAVNKGSAVEPRMIHLVYKPTDPKPTKKVVFVGKGITFDSGGLCIKPGPSMTTMKCDMAGAATTLGIVLAAARLRLPVEVHGLLGSAENMTGAAAYRPGDVYTSREGKTVEIINTDAEGRLVLADVLSYAKDQKPDYLIDHATLTGACLVALGPYRAGMMSNDDELADAYQAAASLEGERYWRLPLDDDLRKQLESSTADIKHVGTRLGGTITAALFLREFIGDAKWLHLDIAGPAFLEEANGPYPKGGTGFGVATALRFLEGLA
ncbi:MAG: leucyl aminopeptidase [Myxococcales bacterium]|nr:leucyl aminopeptidase [Myxococcales bacterium]